MTAEGYDPYPDLGGLLGAALRSGREGAVHAERIAERLGLDPDGGPEAAEEMLRQACARSYGDPVGTVTDLRSQDPRTIVRDGDCLLIPALRLDAAGCGLLRQVISDALPDLAGVRAVTSREQRWEALREDLRTRIEQDDPVHRSFLADGNIGAAAAYGGLLSAHRTTLAKMRELEAGQ